jgi:murein DD-endopeptidase MepM/ murein hydrolase activator NlpD
MRYIELIGCLFFISVTASAGLLPNEERVPGGVVLLELPEKYSTGSQPKVSFQGKPVALVSSKSNNGENHWVAIVGVPLTNSVGVYELVIEDKYPLKLPFEIKAKQYPEEHLTFKNKKHLAPDPETLKRITVEAEHLNKVFSHWTASSNFEPTLYIPVEGRRSHNFGKRRVINGQPRSPHKGIDIAAPTGTPVLAAQTGVVKDVGDYFYTGNTVVVDHGQGMQSIYCHLHSTKVQLQQKVSAKEQIGTVGQTGRATGPHLHFGVNLNNTRVSPSLFFVN